MAIRTEIHRLRYDPQSSAAIFRLACQQNAAYNQAVDILNRKPAIGKLLSGVRGKDGKRKSPDGLFGNIKGWRAGNLGPAAPFVVHQQGFDDAFKSNLLLRTAYRERQERIAKYEAAVAAGDTDAKLRRSDSRPCRRTLKHRRRKDGPHTLSVPIPPKRLDADRFAIPGTRNGVVFQTRAPVPKETVIKSFRLVEIHRDAVSSRTKAADRRYALHLSVEYPDAADDEQLPALVDDIRTPNEIVGVDVGVKKHWAASNGRIYHFEERVPFTRYRRQQQELARKKCNSRRRAKLRKKRLAQSTRRQAEQKRVFNLYAIGIVSGNPKAVALEGLNIRSMTASAAGTPENPGRRVSQKRGLNRSMRDASLARKAGLLSQQAAKRGVPILYVDARGSSQSCSRCGHRHRSNRESQAVFRCRNCGFSANADYNASLVIRNRAFCQYVNPDVLVEDAATGWRTQPSRWGQQPLFTGTAHSSPPAALRSDARRRQGTGQTGKASSSLEQDAVGAQIRMRLPLGTEVT